MQVEVNCKLNLNEMVNDPEFWDEHKNYNYFDYIWKQKWLSMNDTLISIKFSCQ
jgi:hypothetical protein